MITKTTIFFAFFILILTLGCKKDKEDNSVKNLQFSIAETIPVPEPSGLDLTYDETGFWVVSDENSTVYLLDSWGKEVKRFKVSGNDLEGITVIDESRLAVVLERTREVVVLDTSGTELKRAKLELSGELNSGLEGITYDPEQKKIYLVNEKDPILLLTLDENLAEISRDTLNFLKDASGIYFDSADNKLWILSDENQMIFKTNLSGNEIYEKYMIKVEQPEGITFNKNGTRLYIVSDIQGSLYVFNLE
ncbi:MAG: SdiA-regulated domain-containing protein [Ignavibacteriaceae bacterium]